jgi:hypothetical protein
LSEAKPNILLRDTEHSAMRSQFATSIGGRGGRRHLSYVFTEHGAIIAHKGHY